MTPPGGAPVPVGPSVPHPRLVTVIEEIKRVFKLRWLEKGANAYSIFFINDF